ncbi:MAG: hypothetical protein Q7R82_02705 [Candidatus Daviesbacteria bacterium]|nr:hypothetical protein [Candidatus Daviesbacteria bacterium]
MDSGIMTLEKAVDLGEYDPDYLATFPEWHTLSRHIQWEFINKALKNRERQIMQQYAAVNNVLDFSKKSEAQAALKSIEEQYKKFRDTKEKLLMEYSKPE